MKKIWNFIISNIIMTIKSAWYAILAAIIGTIVGIIWDFNTGFFTFFGICIAFVLFIWVRQLWWWITKTGDYK